MTAVFQVAAYHTKCSGNHSTSEEGELANRVAEQHILLEMVQIHDVLENVLKVGAHQVDVLLQRHPQTLDACTFNVYQRSIHTNTAVTRQ